MSERGFALLEVVLASLIVAVLMIGLGGFYLSTVRIGNQDTALISLQRQATLAFDEMARQIGPATLLEFPVSCGGDANGLRATNSCGTFCFHRDTTSQTQLLEERTLNGSCPNQTAGTGTMDLLSGALIPARGAAGLLSTVNGSCPGGGFCPNLIVKSNCVVGAAITLRLKAQLPESNGYQTMTFSNTFAGRTLPVPPVGSPSCP